MRPRLAFAILLLSGSTAFAQDPAGEAGRYTMTPTANGFLRLDTRSGAVSLCAVSGVSAECRAVADDRAALSAEIDRLVAKNIELEGRLAQAGKPLANALPSKEDMGKALDYAEEFMRRMLRLMREDERPSRDRT